MRLVEAAKPTFARHETFHPRYGWFRKAYAVTDDDPQIFSREDAPVSIGVGKNMVRAIRFWGLAAKLIVEDRSARTGASPDGDCPLRELGLIRRSQATDLSSGRSQRCHRKL